MNKPTKVNNFKSPNAIKFVEDLQNENDSHLSNSKRKNRQKASFTSFTTQATDQRDSILGTSICSLAAPVASVCPTSSSLIRYSQFDKENKVVVMTRTLEYSPETESSSEI